MYINNGIDITKIPKSGKKEFDREHPVICTLFLQEHNNKKASMKVKNFRSNSTMTFLFIVTTTLLFSSCASFISTMESTDWKKTTNDNIELLNDAMQTGSNKDK